MINFNNEEIIDRILLDFNIELIKNGDELKVKQNYDIDDPYYYSPDTSIELATDNSSVVVIQSYEDELKCLVFDGKDDDKFFRIQINIDTVLSVQENEFYLLCPRDDYINEVLYIDDVDKTELKTSKKIISDFDGIDVKLKEEQFIDYNILDNKSLLLCSSDYNDNTKLLAFPKKHSEAILDKILFNKLDMIEESLDIIKSNMPYTFRMIKDYKCIEFMLDTIWKKESIDRAKRYINTNSKQKKKKRK